MSYSWLNKYIGLPYLQGGRHPDGIDCYGLCKLIYLEQFDIVLPDWQEDMVNLRTRAMTIESVIHSGSFTPHDEPQDTDFVFCYRGRVAHHVGLFFKDGVIHCHEGGKRGSVFEPWPRFQTQFTDIVVGRWDP